MMRIGWLCLALFAAQAAHAVPMTMTHTGRLLDAAGGAVEGTRDITVTLYDGLGVPVWGDTFADVPVSGGYYAVVLGSGVPLTSEALDGDAVYVGIGIAGQDELVSDVPLGSVPFAIRTEQARNLVGGTVQATRIEGDSLLVGSVVATSDITTTTIDTQSITASGDISASGVLADTVLAGTIEGESVEAATVSATGAMTADSLEVDTLTAGTIEASSVLVNGAPLDGPIVGEWYPTASYESQSNQYEFMGFNAERFNTDPSGDYFRWDGSNTITFTQPGYYRVDMRTITYNSGEGNHVETWKNDSRLHLSHSLNAGTSWRRHATSVVSYFDQGDTLRVRVYCRSTSSPWCYHAGPDYTALTVQYMR